MTDILNDPLADVVQAILEDGVIDGTEIEQLRKRIGADGRTDEEEAVTLREVNDAVKNSTARFR